MKDDNIVVVIFFIYIGIIIAGILLVIWIFYVFHPFFCFLFIFIYGFLAISPFMDWEGRYQAQYNAQEKDKRKCQQKKKRGWD